MNMHQFAKNQFIPSIYSWDTVNFKVPWPDWPKKKLMNFWFTWISIYPQKLKLFQWFVVMEIWLFKKCCNLIGWEDFSPYLRNKNFPKYGICVGTHRRVAKSISGRVRFSNFRAGFQKNYMLNLISDLFKDPSYKYMCK